MCEFCGNDKDIIFPFQLNKCQRCEGEPSLLLEGACGSRAPSPRPSVLLTWKDWKSPKVRRLARALAQERREGEGGEEDLEQDGNEEGKCAEQKKGELMKQELEDKAKGRQQRGGIFQAFSLGKLAKVFSKSKGNKEEKEMTSPEREGEREQGGDDRGDLERKERDGCKEMGDEHASRQKVPQTDRLTKSTSKEEQPHSDSEIFSSLESLNQVGHERKARWKLSGFSSLAKGFAKKDREGQGKAEVKSSETLFVEKVATKEEEKRRWEAEQDNKKQDKGKVEAAKYPSTAFWRGNGRREEGRSGGGDGKRNVDAEEQHELAFIKQSNWRGNKSRKARKVISGRKAREGTEKEGKTRGGERDDVSDAGVCT